MDFERQKSSQPLFKKHAILPVISLSLGLHLAIGVLVLTFNNRHIIKKDTYNKSLIHAKLVYSSNRLKTQQQLPSNVAVPSYGLASKEPKRKQIPKVSDNKVNATIETLKAATKRPQTLPAIKYGDDKIKQDSKPADLDSTGLAQKYLQAYSDKATQRLAQRESTHFRESRNSPDLLLPSVDPFLTENGSRLQKSSVKTDCSSSFNQSMANISGILGGNLQCTKMPALGDFLEKRINKRFLLEDQ